jgi:type II secretory pathway predicted ATPase ExeA
MNERQAYLEFFGLREQPFAPTADPVYFYAAPGHKECLFRLWNTIDERLGIAIVLGNYGAGKTTLLRKLLTGMAADPERYRVAVLASPLPSWTTFDLLESIASQFGIQPPERTAIGYVSALNQLLLSRRDCINTLIVDDAQNLNKRGQLELLRILQNLETEQHKLLNTVLFAQLDWIRVLRAAPNFAQRANVAYTLPSIQYAETRRFIEFRLRQAEAEPGKGPVFDDDAVRAIHQYAEGSPRVMVTLCRNTLLAAGQMQTRRIGVEIVLHTIDKTMLPDRERRASAMLRAGQDHPTAGI